MPASGKLYVRNNLSASLYVKIYKSDGKTCISAPSTDSTGTSLSSSNNYLLNGYGLKAGTYYLAVKTYSSSYSFDIKYAPVSSPKNTSKSKAKTMKTKKTYKTLVTAAPSILSGLSINNLRQRP